MVTIQNVFAVIKGSEEPDRYVLLGNHRDAWTYGAVDPSSGTAALLDLARRYSILLGSGWKPRRTIILCSWDAEEFGMVGSSSFLTTYVHCDSRSRVENNLHIVIWGENHCYLSLPKLKVIDLLLQKPFRYWLKYFTTFMLINLKFSQVCCRLPSSIARYGRYQIKWVCFISIMVSVPVIFSLNQAFLFM